MTTVCATLNRRDFLAGLGGLALSCALPASARADGEPAADDAGSWAQFLGPRRDGVSRETGLNTDWQAKKPAVVWKVPLGSGYSACAVVGDRLYTMTQRGKRDVAVCLDAANGKELWAFDAAPSYTDTQRQGAGPRATPTYDRGRLYCLLPMGELFCLSAKDGTKLWATNIFDATGAKNRAGDFYYWGMAGSPLIEGDLAIVQPGGTKNNSLAAFDMANGKLAWAAGDDPPGYSSPIAIKAAGRRMVISFTGQAVLAVDPAKGTVLWRYVLGNKFDCNCATPLWTGELLFVSSAYRTGCAAMQITGDGDKVGVKEKWRNQNLLNQFPTSVILKDHIYGCHGDLGAVFFRCIELATGQVKWEDRRPGKCSLLAYENHIVCVNERGTVRLIEANPEKYVPKGELEVLTYKTWAAPALLKGRLYLRDEKHIACLDLTKG
jgi:outer membrane protein assembly factor BamB